MNSTTEKKTWTKALLSVDWRADRHTECHTIEFERPTKENPRPDYPVEKDKVLSKSRLSMSGEWGGLYDRIIVKDFDEYSLTFQYGEKEYTITPEDGSFSFGETGMSYTTFWLSLWLKEEDRSLKITHNEAFLRRFRTRLRVLQLTNDDVEALRNVAKQGDAYAQYGYGRWLYYTLPTESSMQEAEELFYSNRGVLPEAYAAYARMWQYGETTENRVDMDSCRRLMKIAAQQGSEWAELELTRNRIFGNGCEAEPEKVAHEIEEKLSTDIDPMWYSFLAYSYELMEGREEDVIRMYELSTKNGQWDDYYYLANIYKERGNMALYEELMEEGINRGSGLCCLFRADMAEEDFQEFSEEEQKRVFCSAVPADENPRGLMIVRTLTEELDGKLTYESADGLGTIVRILIRFPEDTEFVQEPRQDFSRDIYHFEGTRILLVEDHPLNLDIAKNLLERTGVDVETAVNGEDAVKLFRERGDEFDMILMDIRMPVMDGVAATKEIRMSGCGKAETIPIIALTASAYEGDIRRSSAAGMNGSILKPIDPGKLYGVMRHYLYRPA